MKMTKTMLGLAAAGLLATQATTTKAVPVPDPIYVPLNFTASVVFNTNDYETIPAPNEVVKSPEQKVALANKDLINLLNESRVFTDYLYNYTEGAENLLPAGTVFYMNLYNDYESRPTDFYYTDYPHSSIVVSNQFGVVPLEVNYDDNNEYYSTNYYDFFKFSIYGVQGGYSQVLNKSFTESDELSVELYFNDYNYDNPHYFLLDGTSILTFAQNSPTAKIALSLGATTLNSASLSHEHHSRHNDDEFSFPGDIGTAYPYYEGDYNSFYGLDVIITATLSSSATLPAAADEELPFVYWWHGPA
jgi:hypothetical protein